MVAASVASQATTAPGAAPTEADAQVAMAAMKWIVGEREREREGIMIATDEPTTRIFMIDLSRKHTHTLLLYFMPMPLPMGWKWQLLTSIRQVH